MKITRRGFLKASTLAGAGVLLGRAGIDLLAFGENVKAFDYPLDNPENIIYSVCLQCHVACPIKGKVLEGVLVMIDGNPYSPQNMLPHLPMGTSLSAAAKVDGKLCPKGIAGIQSLYDPYRIRKVLKRDGPRGSNKWKAIPFEQAIDEVVNGGRLFADVGENQHVPGLNELFHLKEPALMTSIKEDAGKVGKGEMSLQEFKRKHADHLDLLVNSDHPDLGPINNQFVFLAGRIEHGRKEISQRFVKDAFGSVNWYEHTSICEQSHHIAYKEMTNQYLDGKWTKGKTHMKPEIPNSEFIIFFGTGAFEANFGPTNMAEKVTEGLVNNKLKIVVVDPRFSKTAAKAWRWIPIKPGRDGAFALGMIRWIIENKRYDRKYLENANKAAAKADEELTWSNASWLVKIEDGKPGPLLRADELKIGSKDEFVVMKEDRLVPVSPYDENKAVDGELLVDTELEGTHVKSAFQLLWESASSRSLKEWAELSGVEVENIVELAEELTKHGKKASVELYRGAVQHTNGYYNAQAIITLNLLIGNPDWKGGLSKGGGHWHEMGNKKGQPFNLKSLHPNKLGYFGVPVSREKVKYENTSLFKKDGYPAKRLWYPLTSNVYQEVLPSAADGYPYPIKILFLHKGTPVFSTPAGDKMIEFIKDTKELPLFIACDIVIAETSMYADYIFPDLSVWERLGTPHITPDVPTKTSKIRQPIVSPIPEIVKVFDEEMPICMETIMLAIAEKLGLSGFGKLGFGPGMPFTKMEDFYLKMAANLAAGDKPGEEVPDADSREMELFLKTRKHLDSSVFSPERWRKAAGDKWWEKVVYLLNRGGRFEEAEKAYKGNYISHKFGSQFNIYVEQTGLTHHSLTGKNFSGTPIYEPIKDASGKVVSQSGEFHLITYKEISGGQSRTPGNYWTLGTLPENFVLMNRSDAERLGISDNNKVRLVCDSNPKGVWEIGNGIRIPISGKVRITEGIRPGVIAVSWHYGHWAYGANSFEIDGKVVKGDRRRGTGLCPNAVMLADPYLKNTGLTDPIGGSSSFFDTLVKVVKEE